VLDLFGFQLSVVHLPSAIMFVNVFVWPVSESVVVDLAETHSVYTVCECYGTWEMGGNIIFQYFCAFFMELFFYSVFEFCWGM